MIATKQIAKNKKLDSEHNIDKSSASAEVADRNVTWYVL